MQSSAGSKFCLAPPTSTNCISGYLRVVRYSDLFVSKELAIKEWSRLTALEVLFDAHLLIVVLLNFESMGLCSLVGDRLDGLLVAKMSGLNTDAFHEGRSPPSEGGPLEVLDGIGKVARGIESCGAH